MSSTSNFDINQAVRSAFDHNALSPHWVPRARRRSALQNVGKKWNTELDIMGNLAAAGLDEPIRLLPAPIQIGEDYVQTKNKHIVLTTPGTGGKPAKVSSLGVVAGKWKPLQMPEFIGKFDFLFDKFPPHSLISVGGGRQQGILLRPDTMPKLTKLHEEIEVGFILLNDYSGKGSITVRPISQRLVCTNGMVAMHYNNPAIMRLPHSERGMLEMDERVKLLKGLEVEPVEVMRSYAILAEKQATPELVKAMVEAVHVMPKKPVILLKPGKFDPQEVQSAQAKFEATQERIRAQRQVVTSLVEYENDTAESYLRGSRWLAWQALVEESDYNNHGGQPATSVPMFLGAPAKEQEKGYKILFEA